MSLDHNSYKREITELKPEISQRKKNIETYLLRRYSMHPTFAQQVSGILDKTTLNDRDINSGMYDSVIESVLQQVSSLNDAKYTEFFISFFILMPLILLFILIKISVFCFKWFRQHLITEFSFSLGKIVSIKSLHNGFNFLIVLLFNSKTKANSLSNPFILLILPRIINLIEMLIDFLLIDPFLFIFFLLYI